MWNVWDEDEWNLSFRRNLQGALIEDWMSLRHLLGGVQFDFTKEDSVRWVLDKSFQYTTKSLYQLLTWGGGGGRVRDQLCTLIWKSKIPLEVKVFLWQVFRDKGTRKGSLG